MEKLEADLLEIKILITDEGLMANVSINKNVLRALSIVEDRNYEELNEEVKDIISQFGNQISQLITV